MIVLIVWNTNVKSKRAFEWLKALLASEPRAEVWSHRGL